VAEYEANVSRSIAVGIKEDFLKGLGGVKAMQRAIEKVSALDFVFAELAGLHNEPPAAVEAIVQSSLRTIAGQVEQCQTCLSKQKFCQKFCVKWGLNLKWQ